METPTSYEWVKCHILKYGYNYNDRIKLIFNRPFITIVSLRNCIRRETIGHIESQI